ncbi:hypothetical protein VIGAN_04025200, partial [Vigna angularis var. angularis]
LLFCPLLHPSFFAAIFATSMFQGWDCDSCHEFRPQRYCLSLGVEVIYSLALHTSRCKPIQTYWSWITRLDSCNFVLWFLFRFLVHFSLLHVSVFNYILNSMCSHFVHFSY